MSNSTIINPHRFQLVVAPILAILDAAIWTHHSDWHCRKFSARTHLLLSLYAQLSHAPSANTLLDELLLVAQLLPLLHLRLTGLVVLL
jgi:hypothetical protein